MAAGQAGSGAHLLQRVLHLRPGDASASFALGQVMSARNCLLLAPTGGEHILRSAAAAWEAARSEV